MGKSTLRWPPSIRTGAILPEVSNVSNVHASSELSLSEPAQNSIATTADWQQRVADAERLIETGKVIGLSDEERVTIRRNRETTRSQSQDLADERGSLRTESEALTELPGPAHIAGEIAAAEDELVFVRREHDRLALVQQVIRLAEQRYREQYQSPLLNSAGVYLERFTAGRYDLLTVDDADPSDVQLQVRRSGAEFPEPVAPSAKSRHDPAGVFRAAARDGGSG